MLYVTKDAANPGGLVAAVNLFNQAGIYSQTDLLRDARRQGYPAGVERVVIDDAASSYGQLLRCVAGRRGKDPPERAAGGRDGRGR